MLQEVAAKRGAPSSVNLSAIHANLRSRSALANICAYRDTSGLFTEETLENESSQQGSSSQSARKQPPPSSSTAATAASTIEDEEALLYGDSAAAVTADMFSGSAAASAHATEGFADTSQPGRGRLSINSWKEYLNLLMPLMLKSDAFCI